MLDEVLQVANKTFTTYLYFIVKSKRKILRKTDREKGKEMFGFRVGELSALGIVPDGQSPSLYKQPLASTSPLCQSCVFPSMPVAPNSASTL